MLLFEVLLHVRRLVFDVQARLDPVGDDSSPIAEGGWRRGASDPDREQQAHTIGPSQIQVLADDGFEEVPALHWSIEDRGQTHVEWTDRQAVVVPRGAFGRGHRPRQPLRPAVKEGLDVGGAEGIAGRL